MQIRTFNKSFIFVVLCMLLAPACKQSKQDSCPLATIGCFCDGTSCKNGLSCDGGYCIPTDCIPGESNCQCAPGQNCDLADSQQRSRCIAGICTTTTTPAAGTLGGVCRPAPASLCDARGPDGRALDCVRNQCEITGCPSGKLGCGCSNFGCEAEGELTIYCSHNGLCELGACEPGSLACRCKNNSCNVGLDCIAGLCRTTPAASQVTIRVDNAAVHACDIILTTANETGFGTVALSPTVVAKSSRNSPQQLAISFVARDTAALDIIATLAADGQNLQVNITSAACYDVSGQPVTAPNLSVN